MNLMCLLQSVLFMASVRQIICHTLSISTPEEQVEGIKIGTLSGAYSPPYQLLRRGYLTVNEETGDLYTTEQKIDRERLCPSQDRDCTISDEALVGSDQEMLKIIVTVEDINDNAPYFDTNKICLSIPEDTESGIRVLLDNKAWDEDVGSNGEISYHLEGAEGFFSVAQNGFALELVVEKELDREAQGEHHMALIAVDGGSVSLSATVALVITVLDVNDNCPQFSPDNPDIATVPGGAAQGTTVSQVQATDRDLGSNAQILYSFNPLISERAKALFHLDQVTGRISLAMDVKLDTLEEHVLIIVANSPPCPAVLKQVTVYLQPVVMLEPAIKIKFVAEHKNETIVLRENEPPSLLALLQLRDTSSIEAVLSLQAGSMPFTLKEAEAGNYLLSASKPLDFELCSDYHVTVLISEPQGKRVHGSKVIKVVVEDVNDNAPQFEQPHYQAEIEENNKPSATLTQVRAIDIDIQLNGKVSYWLIHAPHFFSIDETTGVLFVSESLDREQQETYFLTVLAKDQGSPSLEASVSVSVNVLDQNDNPPTFIKPCFIFFVSENIPQLDNIGKIRVMDPDKDDNGKVIDVRVLADNIPFVMDLSQSMLRCIAEVDREKQDRYDLVLLAVDGGSPSRSSTASLIIFVEDVNDNQPQVILPSSNLSCLTVPPSTKAGSFVTKIYAIDNDLGINSEITYHMIAMEAAWQSPFQIDPHSGNITVAHSLTGRDYGLHHLFIKVSDGGKPVPLQATVWVNLLVNESLEQCHLASVPEPPCQNSESTKLFGEEPIKTALPCSEPPWLILLCGLGILVISACMLLATVVICMRHKTSTRRMRCMKEQQELMHLNF